MKRVKYAGFDRKKTTSIYYILQIKETIKADLILRGFFTFKHKYVYVCVRACLNTYI